MASGVVDVVAERDVRVGGERDLIEFRQPTCASVRGQLRCGLLQALLEPAALGVVEVAFDVPDLPVQAFLPADGRQEVK